MQVLRRMLSPAAIVMVLCLAASASADESFLSKLNPFSSTPAPKPKPFPGFAVRPAPQPAPSLVSRTFTAIGQTTTTIGQTTKTAWNKTTNFLSPTRWWPSPKPSGPVSRTVISTGYKPSGS